MRILLEFKDDSLFTASEAEQTYKLPFGQDAKVTALPDNDTAVSHLYFAIQNLATINILEHYYEFGPGTRGYETKVAEEKEKIIKLVSSIFDKVVEDNEERIER